jgi:hypothetical protein
MVLMHRFLCHLTCCSGPRHVQKLLHGVEAAGGPTYALQADAFRHRECMCVLRVFAHASHARTVYIIYIMYIQ